MPIQLYLTPASISYLTQWILAGLIGGYLWYLVSRPSRKRHTWLLALFMISLNAFLAAAFL